jgi:hypothetical protein
LANLTPEQARALLSKAIEALKRARERLAQNPTNSLRPPGTRAPWEQSEGQEQEQEQEPEEASVASAQSAEEVKPGADSESESEQKEPQTSPEGKGAQKPAGRAGLGGGRRRRGARARSPRAQCHRHRHASGLRGPRRTHAGRVAQTPCADARGAARALPALGRLPS